MLSLEHLASVVIFALIGFILIRYARKQSKEKQYLIGNILAFSLAGMVILWTALKITDRGFILDHDLPFHLCNFIALFLPFFSLTRKYLFYEILLFWILAGTTQALITPDIKDSFPNYHFIKYWFVHGGLVIFILYATLIYGMRPTWKSVIKSFIALQVYLLLMFLLNAFTGANYFYVNHKPESASLLDYFGEWPYYLFFTELILLPYFFLIYLPFLLTARRASKK